MKFGDYRLQAQLGVGRDGVSYRAWTPDGSTEVEIRDLTPARSDPERWLQLSQRLRLAARLDHEGVWRVRELHLENEHPFVVLEWPGIETLVSRRYRLGLFSDDHAITLIRTLAGSLAEAHRVSLVHGRIDPSRVRLSAGEVPKLDFTGIETEPHADIGGFSAPERAGEPDRSDDVEALGLLLAWMLIGDTKPRENAKIHDSLASLIRGMRAADPVDRPSARDVERRLSEGGLDSTGFAPPLPSEPSLPGASWQGLTLGRFRVLEKLGEGGQGVVYRAIDTADETVVALKTLRPEWASRPDVLRRFRKEARLLASVNNPNVVNLLEHNEDGGVSYFVMEYVTGQNLAAFLESRGKLDEPTALAIAADVAKGLEDAHARGIVHRDVKPANILVIESSDGSPPKIKLSDFGLARNVVDSESMALTDPGAIMGTPFYMSPEQCTGRPVDSRSDVYALGVTLFHMLAGRLPFNADTREQILSMHCHEPPPPIRQLVPEVSDGVSKMVDRALAKSPDDRYPDAAAFRRDIERLARGEPTDILLHPILPDGRPKRTQTYEFQWELEASPRQLWPLVTNTDRLDRALGFPPVKYSYSPDPARGVRLFAEGQKAGMNEIWEEFPYEWVEPWRMGVLREYTRGPFRWLVSTVELSPRPGGGTTLTHKLHLEPRGWTSRVFSPIGVGVRFRATLEKVYRRIDAALTGKLGPATTVDPFEPAPALSPALTERLERRLDALAAHGVEPAGVERLGDFLINASSQDLSRIRPKDLAGRWGLGSEATLAVCLHAVGEGLLVLLWDILCPKCRVSCEVIDTLRAIREHGRCEACQLDFDLDFAGSVELIFRAHPEVRDADTNLYCSGGPAHAPHVPARVRVAPGERIELELMLPEGAYRLGGQQLPWTVRFKVQPDAVSRRVELNLREGPTSDKPPALAQGGQVVVLYNPEDREFVVQVERESPRENALTAAQALTFPVFRDLFPGEMLSPGQLCNVAAVTLLVTDLVDFECGSADVRHFGVVYEHFCILDETIRRAGGTLVKTVGDGVFASFRSPEDAVRVAFELPDALAANESTRHLRLRTGVHRGPAFLATLAGRLDYFGETSTRTSRLLAHAGPGELILTAEAAADPGVSRFLEETGRPGTIFVAGSEGILHKFTNR